MDIVHHAFIGGAGYLALAANEQELAGMAFVAGSVFPDLDVVFMTFGKRAYLKNHQGLTHSLLLAPVFALFFIALPLTYTLGFEWNVFIAALLGIWLHSLLDLTNTFGITIIWPVTVRRFCFDAVFFIDSVAWALTAMAYVGHIIINVRHATSIYAVLLLCYIFCKYQLHRYVLHKLNCRIAIPSALNPLHYFILEEHEQGVRTYLYNVFSGNISGEEFFPMIDRKYYELAGTSTVYNDIKQLTKYFYITDVSEDENGLSLTVRDLGIRNFGGKFGRTELKFDRNQKLISETANI